MDCRAGTVGGFGTAFTRTHLCAQRSGAFDRRDQRRHRGARSRFTVAVQIKIKINHLTDAQWDKVFDALAEQAIFTAQLLAGEMPQESSRLWSGKGQPVSVQCSDLKTDCSCPDYSNPCKHIAATHYILGERFDEDPFLIFRLRGRTQEQVMVALRQRRAGRENLRKRYRRTRSSYSDRGPDGPFLGIIGLDGGFAVSIRPPAIEMPLLKRLGEANFVPAPGIQSWLSNVYQAVNLKGNSYSRV